MVEQILNAVLNHLADALVYGTASCLFIVWRMICALRSGLQALLRDRMIQAHDHYTEKGFMPIYARENFDNCYKSYKGLGADGVIDELVAEIHALPIKERQKGER